MKICQKHWDALRKAIDEAGMGHLVTKSGEQLADKIKKELNDELVVHDPLFSASMKINEAALQTGGLYLMMPDENGDPYCPLCEALKHTPEGLYPEPVDENWIKGAVGGQLQYCRQIGLMGES